MKQALRIGLALLGVLAATPGFALYKVVGPDGKVSYTDRAPQDEANKVQALASVPGAGGGTPDAALPFELRQVVQRYPVTLYTTADCSPCDSGRALLRQRGVPYTEKSISTSADSAAFKRLGGQGVPMLQIGSQQVRSFSESEWSRYLDAAAYPAQSRLPRNYSFAPATPLVAVDATSAAPAKPAPKPVPVPATAPAAAEGGTGSPPGFRF